MIFIWTCHGGKVRLELVIVKWILSFSFAHSLFLSLSLSLSLVLLSCTCFSVTLSLIYYLGQQKQATTATPRFEQRSEGDSIEIQEKDFNHSRTLEVRYFFNLCHSIGEAKSSSSSVLAAKVVCVCIPCFGAIRAWVLAWRSLFLQQHPSCMIVVCYRWVKSSGLHLFLCSTRISTLLIRDNTNPS